MRHVSGVHVVRAWQCVVRCWRPVVHIPNTCLPSTTWTCVLCAVYRGCCSSCATPCTNNKPPTRGTISRRKAPTKRPSSIKVPAHLRPADVSHVPVVSFDWSDMQFYVARHEPFDPAWAEGQNSTPLAVLKQRWLEQQRSKWGGVVARFGGQVGVLVGCVLVGCVLVAVAGVMSMILWVGGGIL